MCREVLLPQLCVERCCWLNCVSRGVVGSIVCREVLLAQLCVLLAELCVEVLLAELCVERCCWLQRCCCCLNCV